MIHGIREVHYEITDRCNAGCPQCVRTNPDGCLPWDWVSNRACSLEDFQKYSPSEFLCGLKFIYFCGNFGDPILAPDLLPILEYCYRSNPNLSIKVHSNCGAKSKDWWRELAAVTRGKKFVLVAGLDGTTVESHARYRLRVNLDRALENVNTFITGGGSAEWRFIAFRHNQSEIESARKMSQSMGFVKFSHYSSSRFFGRPEFAYSHSGGHFFLEPAQSVAAKFSDQKRVPAAMLIEPPRQRFPIDCRALATNSIFIDQDGNITPCCHIGIRLYTYLRDVSDVNGDRQIYDIFDEFGAEKLSARENGFESALRSCSEFNRFLARSWAAQGPFVCRMICGKNTTHGLDGFRS